MSNQESRFADEANKNIQGLRSLIERVRIQLAEYERNSRTLSAAEICVTRIESLLGAAE